MPRRPDRPWRGGGPLGSARRAVVVSPHLDDAALSLGATIARATARGAEVAVVTVFAGDPGSAAAAGPWDHACGFPSEGEAARARRAEDERACAILGARPIWLPFGDEQYAGGRTEAAVMGELAPLLADADVVLVPGHPLANGDHAWLARALAAAPPAAPLALYAEQPYAADAAIGRARGRALLRAARIAATTGLGARPRQDLRPVAPTADGRPWRWEALRPTRGERRRKEEAIRAYASQLASLGGQLLRRIHLDEAVEGGERVAHRAA
ncbi:MAG TPA: PIG-L family deacetylase [Polyangia bacterium]|jgi:LmbE family N-acetylglucosaminyl deacetylase|nr:PIG-L family deacetylase [Polyangia bacterium]